jgi:hypothetical protein
VANLTILGYSAAMSDDAAGLWFSFRVPNGADKADHEQNQKYRNWREEHHQQRTRYQAETAL